MDAEMMETIRANARYYRLANGLSGAYIGDAIGHDASWVQQFEDRTKSAAVSQPRRTSNRNGKSGKDPASSRGIQETVQPVPGPL